MGRVPCSAETESLCPDKIQPHDALDCLQAKMASETDSISPECLTVLMGYSNCDSGGSGQAKPKPGPNKPAPGVAIASSYTNAKTMQGKPKPKPDPDSRPCWSGVGGEGGPDAVVPGNAWHDLHGASTPNDSSQSVSRAGTQVQIYPMMK